MWQDGQFAVIYDVDVDGYDNDNDQFMNNFLDSGGFQTLTFQYRSECRKEPIEKCSDRREEECKMDCQPVYWCKMCN